MTNSDLPLCKIGDRIECAKYYGTIKYIGPVDGKPSTWLGIDWDDPQRGKHNGNVNGVQYFTTRHEKSGSFVRPEKVDFGKSAVASIVSRYGQNEDEFTAKINQQKHLLIQQTMNAPFLEMVGFDKVFKKQRDFSMLKVVNLREQNVCSAGPAMELVRICPQIEELDLSKNLLSTWSEVFDICEQLNNLHWLNVSSNIMIIPETFVDHVYPNIKTLICGSMELSWDDILKIATVFPNVEEFRAPFNKINSLNPLQGRFPSLKLLDLEGNTIQDWSEVCKLDSALNLDQLIIENIELDLIRFNESEFKVSVFKNLKKLCIVNNLINDWQSIAELNRLQSLEHLKITKNPIMATEEKDTIHQLLIAKIAGLKILNGVEIETGERRGAEYDYIKKYGLEWLQIKNSPERINFLKVHNRYLELIEKYGEPEESELVVKPKVIKSSLIELNISFGGRVIKKKLPPTITIQKLVMMIQKLFRLGERPVLTYFSQFDHNIQIALNDELKEIGVYSMQDGDEINVSVN